MTSKGAIDFWACVVLFVMFLAIAGMTGCVYRIWAG